VRKATGLEKDSRAAEGIAFGMSGIFVGSRISEHHNKTTMKGGKQHV